MAEETKSTLAVIRDKKRKLVDQRVDAQEAIDKLTEDEDRIMLSMFAQKAREVKSFYVYEVMDTKKNLHIFPTRATAITFAHTQTPFANVDETELDEDELKDYHNQDGIVHFEPSTAELPQ